MGEEYKRLSIEERISTPSRDQGARLRKCPALWTARLSGGKRYMEVKKKFKVSRPENRHAN